jgi:hypothetical protein
MNFGNLIKTLFLLIIGMAAGFYFLNYEKNERATVLNAVPCQEPLTFKIGDIDSRFDVSEADVLEAMNAATTLWSDALGREVAMHSEEGSVTVHFVYDERQETVDGEMRFRQRIESEQVRLNQLQAEYDRNRDLFEARSERYVELASETTDMISSFNSWVEERNRAGGFRPEESDEFENRKASVEQMQQRVLNERRELDRIAAQLNRDAERLNRIVEENNRLVEQYNSEFTGVTRFTKATFQNRPEGGVITVNMFLHRNELTLILAHELGHALGLDHVANPRSVMYSQMGAQELFPVVQLTEEDREAIRNLCN